MTITHDALELAIEPPPVQPPGPHCTGTPPRPWFHGPNCTAPPTLPPDMFMFIHYKAHTVDKRPVGILLECFLVESAIWLITSRIRHSRSSVRQYLLEHSCFFLKEYFVTRRVDHLFGSWVLSSLSEAFLVGAYTFRVRRRETYSEGAMMLCFWLNFSNEVNDSGLRVSRKGMPLALDWWLMVT